MTTHYVPLEQVTLANNVTLARPPALPELVHIDDAAVNIMIDLTRHQLVYIAADCKFSDIQHAFALSNLVDLFVLDQTKIMGIISARDLHGALPTKIIQEKDITRQEINARMLATPCQHMLVFEYSVLQTARVGNVIESFNRHKKKYALIVDDAPHPDTAISEQPGETLTAAKQIVRGVIVAAKLKSQLTQPEVLQL